MKNVKRILLSMILVVVIQLCFPCDTISDRVVCFRKNYRIAEW